MHAITPLGIGHEEEKVDVGMEYSWLDVCQQIILPYFNNNTSSENNFLFRCALTTVKQLSVDPKITSKDKTINKYWKNCYLKMVRS